MQQPGDLGSGDEMTEPALAFLEMDSAQVVAVELHQIEGPQHEVVLDALVHLTTSGGASQEELASYRRLR